MPKTVSEPDPPKEIGALVRGRGGFTPAWATAIVCAIGLHAVWWWICEPPTLFSDFFKAYYPAAEHLWEAGLASQWPFTEAGAGGFVNLPILAWLFVPLVPLGEVTAGWVFLGIGIVALLAACALLIRVAGPEADDRIPLAILTLVAVSGPLVNSLREGNTTHFILLLLAAAVLLLRARRDVTAGIVLGFCATFKLPLFLLLAYFAWRNRWRVMAGSALSSGGLFGLSIGVFGWAAHVSWFELCVAPFLAGTIPAFNVQSIDGFLMRLDTGTRLLREWEPLARPMVQSIVRAAILVVLFGAAYLAFRVSLPPDDGDRSKSAAPSGRDVELEFSIVLMLALVSSPVSWTHYYHLMLLPWSLLLGGVLKGKLGGASRMLFLISVLLSSLPVVDVPEVSPPIREVLARTLISAWLFGGLALLTALIIERRQMGHSKAEGVT